MSDIFGITTDESVLVEETKNKLRKDPTIKEEAIIKTSSLGLKNIDNIDEIPINQYSYESNVNDAIKRLQDEAKKIRDAKTK